MEYPSFNKVSTGPEDEGFFFAPTAQPNWWRTGVRIAKDGVITEVMLNTYEVGEFEYGALQNIRFNAIAHERVASTSDAPPELVANHLVIAQ